MYTDFGLFTCDPAITREVVNLFHHLTGYSREPEFERLLVAPINMRERFIELIHREADNARAGRPSRIVVKINQLEDLPVCQALSDASRGCPGRPDHPRLQLPQAGGRRLDREHPRALDHRAVSRARAGVSLRQRRSRPFERRLLHWLRGLDGSQSLAPDRGRDTVAVRALRERVWEVLQVQLEDRRNAWQMQPDGSYVRLHAEPGASEVALEGSHVTLMKRTRARLRSFEP